MTLNLHKDGVVPSEHGCDVTNGGLGVCHPLYKGSMGSRKKC